MTATGARTGAVTAPLRVPAFRSIWLSDLVSDAGDWLLFIALPLVVLDLTGSAFGTSLAFLFELVPGMVLTPAAAWCAHRLPARRFLAAVGVAQALVLAPLLVLDRIHDAGTAITLVYAVIVGEAALTALSDPARNALLPRLVRREDLVSANSLIGSAENAARLIGGPLGGVLLAFGGLPGVVAADLATFLAAAVLIVRAAVPDWRPRTPPVGSAPRASGRAVLGNRKARWLLAVTFGCQIAQGMFVVLFVLFVVRRLDGNSADVGLLRGVQAVGAIVGALALAALARRATPAALIAGSTLLFGALSALVWNGPAVTTSLPLYVVLFAIVGAPGVVLGTGLTSGMQADLPHWLHAHAFGLAGFAANAGQAIGIVLAGTLTASWGLSTLLDLQAGVYLTVGAVAAFTARPTGTIRPD